MTNPTRADFKSYFTRDFPYGDTSNSVNDADIDKALTQAEITINEALFGSQTSYEIGFLALTAHFLVMDLRAASQGIAGSFQWLESSKGVGSVSTGISIPQYVLDHPVLGMLSKTNYGAKYLGMILGAIAGQVFSIQGQTSP